MVNAIPASLKHAVSSGVGLFIALLGCKNAGLIIALEGKNNLPRRPEFSLRAVGADWIPADTHHQADAGAGDI